MESPISPHASLKSRHLESSRSRKNMTSYRNSLTSISPVDEVRCVMRSSCSAVGPSMSSGSGSGSPSTTKIAESSNNKNPAPPASTTPASLRTSNCSGVFASATRPATRAVRNMADNVAPCNAAAAAASADSRTTVRIVPSIGLRTASYAATDAFFNASATLVADAR